MRSMTAQFLVLSLLLSVITTSSAQAQIACRTVFAQNVPVLKKFSYRLMTYNVENLFNRNAELDSGKMFWQEAREKGILPKSPEDLAGVRRMISEQNPDFAVLQEVENVKAVRDMLEGDEKLKNQYYVFLKEGNDPRGIDIGFIVKKNLGLRFKFESHKDMTRGEVVYEGGVSRNEVGPLFSRDLPVLMMFKPGQDKPVLILMGNHGKSKRNSDGDFESRQWRTDQYKAMAEIIKDYEKRFGKDVPIIVAGDFNTEVQTAPEMAAMRSVTQSAFDIAVGGQVPKEYRITHAFFPRKGSPNFAQLDDVRFRNMTEGGVIRAEVVRYKNAKGEEIRIPKSFKERSRQPSDHYPIVVDIKLAID